MGPAYPEHARWGKVVREVLSDKGDDTWCDDQSALVYLLLNNWERLVVGGGGGGGKKVYIETEYFFMAYWVDAVDQLDGVTTRYKAVERRGSGAGMRRGSTGGMRR